MAQVQASTLLFAALLAVSPVFATAATSTTATLAEHNRTPLQPSFAFRSSLAPSSCRALFFTTSALRVFYARHCLRRPTPHLLNTVPQ